MSRQLSDSKAVKILADACYQKGMRKVVISAGSRNAPLILTFNRRIEFETFTITDERSAAFFALGMAEQTGESVGLICTSGTALLNYSPAIAEAYYKGIPLVVMSADRPIEQIDQGDGQAIRQVGALSNFVKFTANLPIVDKVEDEWHVKNLVINAFYHLVSNKKGPVHINVPLREPIYGTCVYNEKTPIANILDTEKVLSEYSIQALSELFNSYKKILILPCTTGCDEDLRAILEKLSELPQVVVLTETINNLHSEKFFNGVDKYIELINKEGNGYAPDLLITLGDILISRMIKKYLKNTGVNAHWHISKNSQHIDMFHNLTFRIDVSPKYFFNNIKLIPSVDSNYSQEWRVIRQQLRDYHDDFVSGLEWSDFKAFLIIATSLHDEYVLHSGNSTVVRYLQIIEQFASFETYCNRGTSGIDGSVSTAVGAACINDNKNLLITGDLSFYYDSNALWNKYVSDSLKIIVINNEGGGIFRFIQGPSEHEELGEFFEHHQVRRANNISKAFGLDYYLVKDEDSLNDVLEKFLSSPKKSLLEIKTPRKVNDKVLSRYFNNIK